ncbi:AAT-domain-containing protein [Dendrothele bispora CBS 962.96]|uniref:AAT-domain-containing protein n=1 Tax=Dendrothele bispora (strain CBS 962.96) TaxID=1314807 RepID=A0A4S8M862_DENBC|nr:AAT-domain-containing protein [Dendrothele bispora CBS 962.96]
MTVLTVELSGSPREIGLEHGRRLSAQIKTQIKVYDAMFKATSKLDWSAVREIAKTYATTIESLTPAIYSEILAIAEGASLDVLDIVALNARSEIALGLFSDGCTSLGWKYSEDQVFLSQNWDWTARVKENVVMMSIDQPGKPKIWMVTEAGIIGKIGFNSSSVGTCLNAIRARPTDPKKLPIHLALRIALESTSTQAALSSLESFGVASAQHILIADPSGPLSLELAPVGKAVLQPNSDGFVAHTNHFLENKFVDEPLWLANSPIRLNRINELTSKLVSDKQAINGAILRERIFSDTYNAPGSICCQEDPTRPIETRSSTLFCIVMKFVKGQKPTAEVVWGKPGSGEEGKVLHIPW